MALHTYDPKAISMIVGGFPIDSGLAPDTFVSIEMNEDLFTLQIGADGEGTRSKTNNLSATITFTLQQTSDANDYMSGLHNADILSKTGAGVVPVLIKDIITPTTFFSAKTAWIVRFPTAEFGNESGTREWQMQTDFVNQFQGGLQASVG
jgi:hypothetical protein